MLRLLLAIFSLTLVLIPASAQYDVSEFRWEFADIAFSYPSGWDQPFAVQQFGVESVIMAASDVQTAERAPEIPTIVMTIKAPDDTTLSDTLENNLNTLDIQIDKTIPTTVLNKSVPLISGISRDETFFGMGTILEHNGNVVTVVGRAPIKQQSTFEAIFSVVVRSMTSGEQFGTPVPYGLVWSTFPDTNFVSFSDLTGVAVNPTTHTIYSADIDNGLLQFDMLSGRLLEVIPNPDFVAPFEIAIGLDNTVYVADTDCPCIHVYSNNAWQDSITGFGIGSPLSITTDSQGNLFATDNDGQDFIVRQFSTDDTSSILNSDEPFLIEPVLFTVDGEVYAYDSPIVQQLDGSQFVVVDTLEIDTFHNAIQIAPDGTYLLGTGTLIDLYTPDGLLIESIDLSDYTSASTIQGMQLGNDNTLYIAMTGNGSPTLLALSQFVPSNSFGLPQLAPYRISGGFLNEQNTQDIWIIDNRENRIVDIEIQGLSPTQNFDFSAKLMAPDGSEVTRLENDSSANVRFSRNFRNIELSSPGLYQIQIDRLTDSGSYDITLITPTRIEYSTAVIKRYGQIPTSYPTEQWILAVDGQATLIITAESLNPTQFDPKIALFDMRGRVIEQNDDALIGEGNTAQIAEFTTQFNGEYIIEVSAIEGIGHYRLTIETISPDD